MIYQYHVDLTYININDVIIISSNIYKHGSKLLIINYNI